MQPIPSLGAMRVAVQLVVAGRAPDVCRNAVLFEQRLRLDDFVQNRAAANQLRFRGTARRLPEAIKTFDDAIANAIRHRWHLVLLVHDGDVVEGLLVLAVHSRDAVFDDRRELVRVRWIVGATCRNRQRQGVRIAVLMLQSFAGERGPA